MSAPRLLDLYCGAGGCSVGYSRAGFEVTGVDIKPMPRYPFAFHQADALEFLAEHGHEYDAIHASPPCQRYSRGSKQSHTGHLHPDLIGATRSALLATGRPYVIENVADAYRTLRAGLLLCGAMFPGLRTYRHRLFDDAGRGCRSDSSRVHRARWPSVARRRARPARSGPMSGAGGSARALSRPAGDDGAREAVPVQPRLLLVAM
jgi:DNA (cytosine-5)-methyltransferase 1